MVLSGLALSFVFCHKTDSEKVDEECVFEDFSITEDAKYFEYIGKVPWHWYIEDNRLIIEASNSTCDNEFDRVIKFDISKGCPEIVQSYLFSCPCDADCPEGEIVYVNNLKIQKWALGEIIIGTNAGTDFWVDLTENNHRDIINNQCFSDELSITQDAKYYLGVPWLWHIYEGNLRIIALKEDCDNNFDRSIIFQITKECPEIIESYYASCSCDSDFELSCISSDYTYYDTDLKIQTWIPGQIIIGANAGTDFRVEMTEINEYIPSD